MTHKHPLQHPAHKNTSPHTSACLRAQLGPRRGTRSSLHPGPAIPSQSLSHPSTEQAGNLRTKYGKDITITFKPQNTNSSCCFFVFLVCYRPHTNLNLLSQGSAYGSTFHGRKLGLPTTTEQKLFNLFYCLFPKLSLPSLPPTLRKMTRQGQFWSTSSDFPRSSVKHLKSTRKNKCCSQTF